MDNELIVNEKERKKEKRKLIRDIVFIILFGLLIIWFTGSFLANRNNIENNDNDIKTELVSSSNKNMKQANRNKVDSTCKTLNYFDFTTNTIDAYYVICDAYIELTNGNYVYLYNALMLTYDLDTSLFTSALFDVEVYDDYGDFYFNDTYTPTGFLNYLNTGSNFESYIYTYFDSAYVNSVYGDGEYNYSFDISLLVTDYFSWPIYNLGNDFYLGDIVAEINSFKNLANSKLEEGYGAGYEVGSEEGYEEGYTDGYDVGLDEGYYDGFDFGYETGLNEGLADGYREGYDDGLDEGYTEGVNVGYQDGYQVGITDLQKENLATTGFKTLFNAILNAPYNIFKGILNFEFLGINLFSLFSFIFTTMLILWIVKIFKK